IRNISSNLFFALLRITGFNLKFFNVDRSKDILFDHSLTNYNSVLEVIASPRHESHQNIAPNGKLSLIRRWTISQYLTLLDPLLKRYYRTLINTCSWIGTLILHERIDVDPWLSSFAILFNPDNNARRIDIHYFARSFG